MVVDIKYQSELVVKLNEVLNVHSNVRTKLSRKQLIQECLDNREAILTKSGALATWRPADSTGRSPNDTVIVRRTLSEHTIDWEATANRPISEETFDLAWNEAMKILPGKEQIYITEYVIGSDPSFALPVKTVCDQALHALFTDNMFRKIPDDINQSIFAKKQFILVVLPLDKLNQSKFNGKLRRLGNGRTSDMLIAMDFDRALGLVYGSSYCGSV